MIRIVLNKVCVGKRCRRVPFNTANVQLHWAVKAQWKSQWETAVGWAVLQRKRELGKIPLINPTIKIIVYHCKTYDLDGLACAIKPVQDGLVKVGLIKDDSPEFATFIYEQKKVNRRSDERMEIEIL